MDDEISRSALRKLENAETFPLVALQTIREVRATIDAIESRAILTARELGASLEDVADAMGITRQGVAYRIKRLSTEDSHEHAEARENEDIVDLTAEENERPNVP
jgi:predicted transcriptional regulator